MAEPGSAPVPQRIGRFQIIRHLAMGGMAELLLAMDGARHVVIKRIRGEQARDSEFVKMFLSEARLAGSLRHEHVVEVFEIGEQSGEYFFAMEHVHGADLRKVLHEVNRRDDQVPIAQIIAIMCAAAAGLHHAHEKRGADRELLGIVHRDVSPANILVGYDGTVKVADFGIAKAVLRQVETRSGTLRGKISYMSPEQVTGRAIDRRSDVFALGIVLYEIATARRLFKGDNDFLVMSEIVHGHFPKPSLLRADLPHPLENIIMKALEINPGARYQTADELRCALEEFAHSLGMRPSAMSVADYMLKLFGHPLEPWNDDAPTLTAPFEFDGSASGVVSAASSAEHRALPSKLKAPPSSLIAIAHAEDAHTGAPSGYSKPSEGGGPRSRSIVIAAVATIVVAIGTFAITKVSVRDGQPSAATPAATTPHVTANEAAPPAAAARTATPPTEVPPVPTAEEAAAQAATNAAAAKLAAKEAAAAEAAAKKQALQDAAAQQAVAKLAAKEAAAQQELAKQAAAKEAAALQAAAKVAAKEAAAQQALVKQAAAKEAAALQAAAKRAAKEQAAARQAAAKEQAAARQAAAKQAAAQQAATKQAAANQAAAQQAATTANQAATKQAAAKEAAASELAAKHAKEAAAAEVAAKAAAAKEAAAKEAAAKEAAAKEAAAKEAAAKQAGKERDEASAKQAAEKEAGAKRTAAKTKKTKPAEKKTEKKWDTKTLFPE